MKKLLKKLNLSPRFLLTILTLFAIGVAASIAIFLAKGYRFSPEKATFTGTGIMSITSVPDQASVYLDDHLTTATNANINSLVPKTYKVRIVKEGFIPWEKQVEIKEGFVSEVKATLFPAIPTTYPLTFNGVENTKLSPDGQKLIFVVPGSDPKKNGVWVWTMGQQPIALARGSEPHQIAQPNFGIDYTKAIIRFSPDSTQVLLTLSDRSLLLGLDKLNDPPRDITAILGPTIRSWDEEKITKDSLRIQAIENLSLRRIASESATLIWSPDETKFMYTNEKKPAEDDQVAGEVASKFESKEKISFKLVDLETKKTHDLPASNFVTWLPESRHIVLVDEDSEKGVNTISLVDFDGNNQAIIYVGDFDPKAIYPWPDSSRLVMVTSFPTPTAKQPNLYGVNLK